MKKYKNITGRSGVTGYDYGEAWIDVRWSNQIYRYEVERVGAQHLEEMKRLADAGSGLSTYISSRAEIHRRSSSKRYLSGR
jgi:hypothetical protein